MDVAKYIGLFLLKNGSCYIHGLGNLEYRRIPAGYESGKLMPPSHEIAVVAASTIDDSLSNFIATNEQISISKATQAVKDFSTAARAELALGRTVEIPSLGVLQEVNAKLIFDTYPYLKNTGAPVAAEKGMPKRHSEARNSKPEPQVNMPQPERPAPDYSYDYPEPEKSKGMGWGRIALFVFILLAIIGGIGFVLKNMTKPGDRSEMPANNVKLPKADTVASQMPTDTTAENISPAITDSMGRIQFKLILNTYSTRKKAEKRYNQLTSYGNTVELKAEDSNTYYILMDIHAPAADTAHVIDSLRAKFNPNGVYVY